MATTHSCRCIVALHFSPASGKQAKLLRETKELFPASYMH